MPETRLNTYVVSVPGTDQTRELSRDSLLEELARGAVTPDYWVWSPEHEDWKQISEIPALKAPPPRTPVALFVQPQTPIQPIATTSVKRQYVDTKVGRSHRVEDDDGDGFPYVKVLFGFIYAALAAVIALNYLLVDKPFDEALARTPFVLVSAHAHLGSFVQPNALVIHALPNQELNEGNFADFLYTLAKSTPAPPLADKPFEMVALTSSWFSQYALRGADWQSLAKMADANSEDRKNFITDHLGNIAGQPLIRHPDRLSPSDLKAARTQVWSDLTAKFLAKS
jgi:hypothetical protein